MSKQLTESQFRARMDTVKVPEGFRSKFTSQKWSGVEHWSFSIMSEDVEIVFDQSGSGHTKFKTDKGWFSFDRTGVEDSFYYIPLFKGDKKPANLNEIVAEQFKRIEERQAYYKTAISIPGIPFTVSPDRVQELKQKLTTSGYVTFTPSGFGTGYRITKTRQPWCSRAKAELESFFGVTPLYVSTMDCD